MQNKEYVMVGIGELLWDVFQEEKKLGGAPANFAHHVSQLGHRGVVVSGVGTDEQGEALLLALQDKGVDSVINRVEQYPTGEVIVSTDQYGGPRYTISADTAWDNIKLDERHEKLATMVDVVYFGTLAMRNQASASAIEKFEGMLGSTCIRLFDLNMRQEFYSKSIVEKLLEKATVVKLNEEELITLAHFFHLFGSETTMLEQLETSFNLDLIMLTKGAEGSRLFSSRYGDSIIHGIPIEVIDSVGAGDSFAAAVAVGLCQRMDLQDTHLFAKRVATYVCQQRGATPQLPSITQLLP